MAETSEPTGKRFTLEEARALLPEVRRITDGAAEALNDIAQEIQACEEGDPRRQALEQEYVDRINDWASEVREAGCEVKGLFLVDFDNGEGFYCWKWPESDIGHFHGYDEGFAGRMRIN
jgi:hypothetical protein